MQIIRHQILGTRGLLLALIGGASPIAIAADATPAERDPREQTAPVWISPDAPAVYYPFDVDDLRKPLQSLPKTAAAALIVGPTPCDSCDPEDVTNASSPGYDPTILAVFQENDALAPPSGPGTPTCEGVTTFWAGANDQCWGPVGASGRDASFVETQIPAFTAFGQHYQLCGQFGRIDTSGYTGDPNNPSGPLKTSDFDVWGFQVTTPMDIRFKGYSQAPAAQIRLALNLTTQIAFGTSDPLRSCSDQYGASSTWQNVTVELDPSCLDSITSTNMLVPGYYYLIVLVRDSSNIGTPGDQLCDQWYNVTIESTDAPGACCIDDLCVDNVPRAGCAAACGVFRGDQSDCISNPCTNVLGACCFRCANSVGLPCPDPSGPSSIPCRFTSRTDCEIKGGLFVGGICECAGVCSCAADINADGRVTAADFVVLAANFGSGGPDCRLRSQGDLNCDGVVNSSDFTILASEFGCPD